MFKLIQTTDKRYGLVFTHVINNKRVSGLRFHRELRKAQAQSPVRASVAFTPGKTIVTYK